MPGLRALRARGFGVLWCCLRHSLIQLALFSRARSSRFSVLAYSGESGMGSALGRQSCALYAIEKHPMIEMQPAELPGRACR